MPRQRPTRKDGKYIYSYHPDVCPKGYPCNPDSSIGPCIYIRSSIDHRRFPAIPRESQQFKIIFNQRSASERLNSVIDSYKIDRAHRHPYRTLFRLTLVNIMIHANIRYREAIKRTSAQELLEKYLKIGAG